MIGDPKFKRGAEAMFLDPFYKGTDRFEKVIIRRVRRDITTGVTYEIQYRSGAQCFLTTHTTEDRLYTLPEYREYTDNQK